MTGLAAVRDLSPSSLSILDIVLLAVVVYSCVRGFFYGFISELGLLLALIVGTAIAGRYAAEVGAPLAAFGVGPSARAALGYAAVLAGVWIAVRIVTKILRGGARVLLLGWVDRLAGAGFGLVRGLLIVVVAAFLIVHFRIDTLNRLAQGSPVVHAVSPLFPALNSLLAPHLRS